VATRFGYQVGAALKNIIDLRPGRFYGFVLAHHLVPAPGVGAAENKQTQHQKNDNANYDGQTLFHVAPPADTVSQERSLNASSTHIPIAIAVVEIAGPLRR
jgi:hypothetical protein